MLRDLSIINNRFTERRLAFSRYLQSIKRSPLRLTAALAAGALPIAALAWWYYSFVMSVGAFGPLQLVTDTPEVTTPVAEQQAAESSIDATASASSSESNGQVDVNISSSNNSTQSSVNLNGQSVAVPDQGSTHQVIEDANGRTTVDISVDSSTTGSSKTRSSTNLDVDSSTRSKVNIDVKSKENF